MDDTGGVTATALLESWLAPYLAAETVAGARRVQGLPAAEALAATSVDPGCDPGTVDGLPGVALLAEAALAVDVHATLSGLLIDADRPDARLHLDTVLVPGDIPVVEVLRGLASVIPEETGLPFDGIERRGDRIAIWWD